MAYPVSLLIHSCQVETGETLGATADAYGVYPPVKTYTTVACRFIHPKLNIVRMEPGELPDRGFSVILPTGTAVTEGKNIVGLSTGYAKTWKVKGGPRLALLKKTVSHIVCDLEVVSA